MARVCELEYPKGFDKRQRKDGFYLDNNIKQQLDILIKNIADDWDFTILITGGGEVRVGKSVLAMQIAAYWTSEVQRLYNKKTIFDIEHNFVMTGKDLIKKGNELGQNYPFSVLIFDEAGAELEGRKQIIQSTQEVIDFYRECGQYNLLHILVMPEFFDLPKGIALHRSIFLLDVYYTASQEGKFVRGYYKFYSRRNKKFLYLKGKKELDYNAYRYNFQGRFLPFYPIDETVYRDMKQKALTGRQTTKRNKFQIQRDACWFLLNREFKMTEQKISERMEQLTGIFITRQAINDGIRHFLLDNE